VGKTSLRESLHALLLDSAVEEIIKEGITRLLNDLKELDSQDRE